MLILLLFLIIAFAPELLFAGLCIKILYFITDYWVAILIILGIILLIGGIVWIFDNE